MLGKRAYSKMCGCQDCGNEPRCKTSLRRQERRVWENDYKDEQLYPELEDEVIGPQWVLDIIEGKDDRTD
jgi:hypothetical protein